MSRGGEAQIRALSNVIRNLRDIGIEPVLVGGMALVMLGSRRITQDTDLVIKKPETLDEAKKLTGAMFGAGFRYVTRIKKGEEPTSWIDNANIAAARQQIDEPDTIFFWHPELKMKIDLMMDFPFHAREAMEAAETVYLKGDPVKRASLEVLKKMKEIAVRDRKDPRDVQDLDFIKKKLEVAKSAALRKKKTHSRKPGKTTL